ncbi:helix-turn-helix domain-containing protein [uncultured Roseobacter sp.]|uniref:AraC-like ligand-binding domain-containing protein n=1 Tax=uncultured Roseobacter sp. TaxID=114847 RepID=UPI002606B5F4|nr:helix-turn-helix domain-containing protein [uncultured Roseobacter sp.]
MDQRTRYDTETVAARERFAFWRDAVCDSYVQLGCETDAPLNFRGAIDIARHRSLSISRVSGLAHRVTRRRRDIRAATEPYFLLSLQTAQTSRVSQFGQSAVLKAGDMALYSSTEPYRLDLSDDFSQMVVQLPAQTLLDRLPNARVLTARRVDGSTGLGQLVRRNILAFSEHLEAAGPVLREMVQETLIDLIATGLAAESAAALELSSPEQQILLRARALIAEHLGHPDLDRTMVAQALGMSVRRLNGIFAKDGGSLSRVIRHMRLEAVARDLRDPRCQVLSIGQIAFRYGFSNLQSFSTQFRKRFGMSPRAYRRVGLL